MVKKSVLITQFLRWVLAAICVASFWGLTPSAWANPSFKALQQGASAFAQGDYWAAVSQFDQVIRQFPDLSVGYSNRCLAYLQLQQYQQAIADCTQALDRDPTHAEARLNRGVASQKVGRYGDAIADYQQLIAAYPQDYRAFYNLGLTQAELNQHQTALMSYQQALANATTLAADLKALIYSDRGISYLMLTQYSEAIADFSTAIQLDPENIWAYFNRGCAYQRHQALALALQDFSQVIVMDVENAQAYYNRGVIYGQQGDSEDAIANLQQAAQRFQRQGAIAAYQQTLRLIATLQAQPAPETAENLPMQVI